MCAIAGIQIDDYMRQEHNIRPESAAVYDAAERKEERKLGRNYKWVALSNTTLGALMASIDSSILIISLPAIFNGLGVNPYAPGNIVILLWLLLGYMIASSITIVTIGKLSDMFGRVRLYNFGFLIWTIASILIYASSYLILGTEGAISLVILRIVQGLGGGFLFANSVAILTDAFPKEERGKALGINQIAFVGGSIIGLIVGGILSAIDWHLIFLISVPVGVVGTIWAYVGLRDIASIRKGQRFDIVGNLLFGVGVLLLLIGSTYAILPYGKNNMGWSNPFVMISIVSGFVLLIAFAYFENHKEDPMFNLSLFGIRAFSAGNLSQFIAGVARGGLQFMLIIWLQGIWLPLHGISFSNTPLQAGIDMIPLMAGFLLMGPLSGHLSDKLGARYLASFGMIINVFGFLILAMLPANFNYITFALTIFILGIGQGMFLAPNTASIMNSVPPEYRGVSSGMRATLANVSFMFSMVVFFTVLISGMALSMPHALYNGLVAQQLEPAIARNVSEIPPTGALFGALLGSNPMQVLIPQSVLSSLPAVNRSVVLGNTFFPSLISSPFIGSMRNVFLMSAILVLIAAIASLLR